MDEKPPLRLVDSALADPAQTTHPGGSSRSSCLADFGDVLTVEEAAAVLRISRGAAYDAARLWRATRAEGLPVIQIGRRLLVPRTALEMLLARPSQLYAEAASPSDD
jgi:excisionase family DNA binding protein